MKPDSTLELPTAREAAMKSALKTILILTAAALMSAGCGGGETVEEEEPPAVVEPAAEEVDSGDFEPDPLLESDVVAWVYEGNEGGKPRLLTVDEGLLHAVIHQSGLRCLDAQAGELLWTSTLEGNPLVADGAVYAFDSPGNGPADLHKLEAATGRELWSRDPDFIERYNMVHLNDRLYLGVNLEMVVGDVEPDTRISIIDPVSGELTRQVEVKLVPRRAFRLFTADGALYMEGDDLHRLRAENLRRSWSWEPPGERLDAHVGFAGGLAVISDRRLIILDAAGGIRAELELTTDGGNLSAHGETIYLGQDLDEGQRHQLSAVNVDGEVIWSKAFPGRIDSLAHSGEALYAVGVREVEGVWGYIDPVLAQYREAGQDIATPTLVYSLYELDPASGERLRRFDTDFPLSNLLAAENHLYLGADDGRVICLKP
ncbi:MAG: PQQ-binding-like beta-propeller repeat protein [Candidatus Coatesbacteria bacterium]|nr:PQQ-binding-like beta-propeller repeat protein [Candidatus Coatesbacteria bacterium]